MARSASKAKSAGKKSGQKSGKRPAAATGSRKTAAGAARAARSGRAPSRKEIEARSVPRRAAGAGREDAASDPASQLSDRVKEVAHARRLQEAKTVAESAIDAALEKKALLPVLIDVSGKASYTDFIGIVSGRSDRQVDAIAEHVVASLKARGWQLLSREGNGNGRWTLLDFGDIVVHVFYHPVREFYDIESLWIDAPRVKLTVPPEAAQLREEALFYERP